MQFQKHPLPLQRVLQSPGVGVVQTHTNYPPEHLIEKIP